MREPRVENHSFFELRCDPQAVLAIVLPPLGKTGIEAARELAQRLNSIHGGRPVCVVYVADLSSDSEDATLEQLTRRFLSDGVNVSFLRLGITAKQIKAFALGQYKTTGPRGWTIAAKSIPAKTLNRLVENALAEEFGAAPPRAAEARR